MLKGLASFVVVVMVVLNNFLPDLVPIQFILVALLFIFLVLFILPKGDKGVTTVKASILIAVVLFTAVLMLAESLQGYMVPGGGRILLGLGVVVVVSAIGKIFKRGDW